MFDQRELTRLLIAERLREAELVRLAEAAKAARPRRDGGRVDVRPSARSEPATSRLGVARGSER